MNYIITHEPYEQFDSKGHSLGMSEKLAVFYSNAIGRSRYYRQNIDHPQKGMKLLTFKRKKNAEAACKRTNKVSGGGFKVEEFNHLLMKKLTKVGKVIVDMYFNNPSYKLYRCPIHEVFAVQIGPSAKTVCPVCNSVVPEYKPQVMRAYFQYHGQSFKYWDIELTTNQIIDCQPYNDNWINKQINDPQLLTTNSRPVLTDGGTQILNVIERVEVVQY